MQTKRSLNFFYRMVSYFSVSIALVIIILSLILYINFENIALKLIYNSSQDKLRQSSYSMKFLTEYVEGIALQIIGDPGTMSLLSANEQSEIELYNSLNKLQSIRYASPMVHSIYLYNKRASNIYVTSAQEHSMVYPTQNFFDKEILDIIPDLYNYPRLAPIPRRIPALTINGNADWSNIYTYVIYDLYTQSQTVDNIIVINISSQWMHNTLQFMDKYDNQEQNTLIIDNQGRVVFSPNQNEMMHDFSKYSYVRQVLSSKEPSGYFVSNIDKTRYLVTYVKAYQKDWFFVSMTPYSSIVGSINKMKLVTFSLSIAILVLGLISILFLSKRLYIPVNILSSRVDKLEQEKCENAAELKRKFLQNLLKGNIYSNPQQVIDSFREHNLVIEPQSSFFISLLLFDHYNNLLENYDFDGRIQLFEKIGQLILKLLPSDLHFEIVDIDGYIAILFNHNEDNLVSLRSQFNEYLKRIQERAKQEFNLSLTIAVSRVGHTYRDIPYLFIEAVNTGRLRFLYGHGNIIFKDMINLPKGDDFNYPKSKEKSLVQALMLEKRDVVQELYDDFIKYVSTAPIDKLHLSLSLLYFAIKSSVQGSIIEANPNAPDFNLFFSNIQQAETIDEVNILFNELFDKIISYLENQKKVKYDELILKVKMYIEENFSSPILSVNSIADEVDMSSAYLGRLFKQLTSQSIPDYISEVRLKRAEVLLCETDLSVNEIAERVGFTNSSYFYMVFKKVYGMTPNQFRAVRLK